MARPGAQKRNSPRKSALAKAALRKPTASGGLAQGHKPASKAELAEALANRPRVDFLNPFMRYAAMRAKGISLCAFLVTLASFQRGLKVTFHYERASFDSRFAKAKMQGHRGELFSISNGTRTHTFSRTLGDLTDPAANAIAEDKHLTKVALERAGVRTPKGIVVDKSQTALIERFLAQHPGKRFVVKPHDGSVGRGVHTDLPAEQVLDLVASTENERLLVEEHVVGEEFRACVVDGRCVATYRRYGANVIGDGRSSIRALISEKNNVRKQNPYLETQLIENEPAIISFLARGGLNLETVPPEGKRILLAGAANIALGGDPLEVTHEVDPTVCAAAEQACAAIGIAVAGLDLIFSNDGDEALCCVLEINQRPHIGGHSLPMEGPGQGNAVAEAIVDYYFPETIRDRTHPELAYDFAPIRAALESAQITDLSLPVIGPDWRVLRFVETGVAAKVIAKLIETAGRTAGVFVMSGPATKGGVELCLACAPANWRAFLNVVPAQFRTRLEKLAEVAAA